MRLELTNEDETLLRQLIHDYLPELRREIARTEARDFRHELVKREELCERLLSQLGGNGS